MQYYRYYINTLILISFIISSPSINNQLISNEKYITGDDGVIRMYINVMGHVQSPGLYLVYDEIDIITALSISGGYKNGANLNKITVYREDGTKEIFSLKSVLNNTTEITLNPFPLLQWLAGPHLFKLEINFDPKYKYRGNCCH